MLLFLVLFGMCAGSKTRIAFGSCWHQKLHTYSKQLWQSVARERADTFLWLGDAIYGDERIFLSQFKPTGTENMRALYQQQLSDSNYKAMLASLKSHPIGMYDDHDYGLNGAGADFAGKYDAQQLFLDFIGESNSSVRRTRNGLYDVTRLGAVTVLTLDVRFFETAQTRLGDEQWKFVEDFFASEHLRKEEKVVVVASSIQVITGYDRPLQEGWSDHPTDRARLMHLLLASKKKILLVSGDIHFAELNCAASSSGNFIVEATSSGISHAWGEPSAITPSHYTTDYIDNHDFFTLQTLVSVVTRFCVALGSIFPNRYAAQIGKSKLFYKSIGDAAFFLRNYGVIDFDNETNVLTVDIKDMAGESKLFLDFSRVNPRSDCGFFDEKVEIKPRTVILTIFAALVLFWIIARRVLCRKR